jgi:hypothetical protein
MAEAKATPVCNTADFLLFVRHSAKANLHQIPNMATLDQLDPVGTHVMYRSLMHGDGDFVRTWWYLKLENKDADHPVSATFDMVWDDYNKLPKITLGEDGEWMVVTDG